MEKTAILIFLLTSLALTYGQAPNLYFNRLSSQNGLSHNKVNCILQDKRGFMWIGTDDGLNRYDGQHFVHFQHQVQSTSSISGNIITALLEDNDGLLWIATSDGGLSRYDYRLADSLQFKQYTHNPANPASLPMNMINALVQDEAGYLWLGTGGASVVRFNKKTEQFEQPVQVGTKFILALCIDDKGMLWAGRQGGSVLKVNTKTLAYEMDNRYTNLYAGLPHATVTSLFKDQRNNIWMGSWDKVLYRYNHPLKKEEAFQQIAANTFPNDEVLSFAEDKTGNIWMAGRYFGLTLYDNIQHQFFNYRYDAARDGTIANNRVNAVFIDKTGVVWLGTNNGLSVCNPAQQTFVQTFLPSSSKELLVNSFFTDTKNNLWIGAANGLYKKSAESSTVEHHSIVYKGKELQVSLIEKKDDDNFYLGTDFSLFTYNIPTGELEILPGTEKDKVMYDIIDSKVVSLTKDNIDGHPVLLASPYGHYLAYYDLTEKKWVSRVDSVKNIISRFNLQDNLIRKIYKSPEGNIWLATGKKGLGKWTSGATPSIRYFQHNPSDSQSVSSDNIMDIRADSVGDLWVSTYGGGLNYFNVKTEKFAHVPGANNLLEGIQFDNEGKLWMITNGNLQQYDPKLKTVASFTLPDAEKLGGIRGNIYKDKNGTMYVGGNNYYISFKANQAKVSLVQPAVFITDFKIFNRSYSHFLADSIINLSYQQNFFTIEFSAPEYFFGDVEYSYQLEGFDNDWINAGTRNFANYSNLQGGEYIFKVKAVDRKGDVNEKYTFVRIKITPPFWKRLWFYLLWGLIVVGAVYSVYRYRINNLVKQQNIRNKIAQDLHDSVGSTLSSVSVYSQVAKILYQQGNNSGLNSVLEKISNTSTTMISEMNDIVWAINPRNDSMEKIFQRMESFAKPLFQAQHIAYDLTYDKALLSINLSMEKRKNFYLVFKEAVNNIIKYAQASNVFVAIKFQHYSIEMTITDDGVGFNIPEMKKKAAKSLAGNGIINMKRRAAEMNGECPIESTQGEGTKVILQFPVT